MDLKQPFLNLLGTWTGLEEQESSPWVPGSAARASFVFRLDVADTVVVSDYRQVRADGGELTAHGVFQGDPADGDVRWWLFDSYAQPPEPARGRWQDGALTLTRTTPRGTARHRFRPAGDELDYRIELRLGDATDWSPFLAGRYRRVSGH